MDYFETYFNLFKRELVNIFHHKSRQESDRK